jgi:hypothetical protein
MACTLKRITEVVAAATGALWQQGAAVGERSLSLIIGVKSTPAGVAELEELFWAVSDPQDSRWGKHATGAHVAQLV